VEPLVVRISSSTEWLGKRNERSRETLSFETRAERDLMLVLHRPIEPTAQSGHPSTARECPLLGGICLQNAGDCGGWAGLEFLSFSFFSRSEAEPPAPQLDRAC
jgi:hypothetical protein